MPRGVERSYGGFSPSSTLPGGIDLERAEAEPSNGVPAVSLARRPEARAKKLEARKLQAASGDQAQA